MGKLLFSKWSIGLVLILSVANAKAQSEYQVGTLSNGSCWYENKESIRVASFNDKSVFSGDKADLENQLNALLVQSKIQAKIQDMDLTLHCGGYGASLVAKVLTDSGSFCLWTQFINGNLALRSIGSLNNAKNNELCDGHKWGELILGVQSVEVVKELQAAKWSAMIQSVTLVSGTTYKINLTNDFQFRESEVMAALQENFTGKNLIRYIEFNDYRHPIGEYAHLQ